VLSGVALRKVVQSLEEQGRQLWHTTNVYLHPKIHEYAEKLAAKMPGNLKVSKVFMKWQSVTILSAFYSNPLFVFSPIC